MEVLSSMVGVLSKARDTKYSWAIERSSGVHGFWTLLNACPEYQIWLTSGVGHKEVNHAGYSSNGHHR